MMIGLQRHTVRLAEHHPGWKALAADACESLRRAGGDLVVAIEHVGSTAIPGLPAKPILDIAVAVPTLDVVPALVERFTQAGYIYRGDAGDGGGHLFIREPEPEVRSVHVHVVQHGDSQWHNFILFRDTLRDDADVRQRYADLKRNLAERFRDDRRSYTAAKNAFIQEILKNKRQ
jgi:GrpB-like predicted nucleotidyltransferase (UPF0157 family)